jgi:DNA-binding NarL/FixJ family response regulator
MTIPGAISVSGRPLRVAIRAADPIRRAELQRIISDAGHEIVSAPNVADVVLTDDDQSPDRGPPRVALGDGYDQSAGSLPRDADPEQIDAALRAVAAGLIVRAPSETEIGFATMREISHLLLTPREIDVLAAIGDGLGNKAIARKPDISLHTVKFHIESLFRKLGARSRAEAVAKGLVRRKKEIINV